MTRPDAGKPAGTGDDKREQARRDRRRANRRGRAAEVLAAIYLMATGHRVIARRFKTPVGEIDLIAVKRGRIAFVEVKQRATLADCEAAITGETRQRVRRAADWWLARQPRYQSYDLGFDLMFLPPWQRPVYLRDAL